MTSESEATSPLFGNSDGDETGEGVNEPLVHETIPPSYKGRGSTLGASFNFVNSIVGAGIIGMPIAIKDCGLVMGILLLILIALIIDRSVIMLVECGNVANKTNLEELVRHLFGISGYNKTLLFMFLFAYGAMVSYIVVIGDTIPMALDYFIGDETPSKTIVTLITAIFLILPLCLFRDVRKLSSTSLLSLIADFIMIIFVCSVGQSSAKHQGTSFQYPEDVTIVSAKVFEGIGTMSFAFVCQHNTFIVYKSMRNRSMKNWEFVSHSSLTIALSMCMTLGLAGYFSFGNNVEGDILNNFSSSDKLMLGARLLLAVTMIFTYPMEMFVARHALLTFVHNYNKPEDEMFGNISYRLSDNEALLGTLTDGIENGGDLALSNSQKMESSMSYMTRESEAAPLKPSLSTHFGVSLILFTTSVTLALVVGDLHIVLALTGALAASVLGYILPAAVYFKTYEAQWNSALLLFDRNSPNFEPNFWTRIASLKRFFVPAGMLLFGVLALIIGVGSVLYELGSE